MVLGFCNERNRKLACESPTTTPTPDPILSRGKREDQGNEEVRKRETDREEMGKESACRPAGERQNPGSPRRPRARSPQSSCQDTDLGQMIGFFCIFHNKLLFLKTPCLPTKCYFRFLGHWLPSRLDLIYDRLR